MLADHEHHPFPSSDGWLTLGFRHLGLGLFLLLLILGALISIAFRLPFLALAHILLFPSRLLSSFAGLLVASVVLVTFGVAIIVALALGLLICLPLSFSGFFFGAFPRFSRLLLPLRFFSFHLEALRNVALSRCPEYALLAVLALLEIGGILQRLAGGKGFSCRIIEWVNYRSGRRGICRIGVLLLLLFCIQSTQSVLGLVACAGERYTINDAALSPVSRLGMFRDSLFQFDDAVDFVFRGLLRRYFDGLVVICARKLACEGGGGMTCRTFFRIRHGRHDLYGCVGDGPRVQPMTLCAEEDVAVGRLVGRSMETRSSGWHSDSYVAECSAVLGPKKCFGHIGWKVGG